MKNNYNTLTKYIFENREREYSKETINGLFRSILEPIFLNQKIEAHILLKLNDRKPYDAILKRLTFTSAKLLTFSNNFSKNYSNRDIWGDTEFIVVLGQRYSASLIWDFSYAENKDYSNISLLFNSKIISDIAKCILDNSTINFKEILTKYAPDRRENLTLNSAVNYISSLLNDKNQEFLFSEIEKKQILSNDDTLKTAEIVADKAKYIAHEIKNNLSIINLYSKILDKRICNIKMEKEIEESVNNSIKNITTASENVSYLINDLRCLSSPYVTEFQLKQFIYNTAVLCGEKAEKSGIKININEFEDTIVSSDKIKLQCAITNIIFNAIEACKSGCIITIDVNKTETEISITIKNNGEKIPKDIQNKIFEQDYTTKEKGNGLGLAICKQQLKFINGDIFLEYSTEKETAFKIILPVRE